MSSENTPKMRPYWHVDAKWVAGLMLAFILSITLLIFGLVQVTAEQPAVEALTLGTALMFSPNGLDDQTDIALMRLQMEASPDGSIQPIPGLRISVSEQDIEGLTPREIRLFFFKKWAEPIYQEGIEGLAVLADDPELKAQIVEGGGLFNVMTLQTHQALQRALIVAASLSLLMLIPVVVFSYRFGRIGSPGCVMVIASLPGAILFTLIGKAVTPVLVPPGEEGGMTGMLGYLLSNILPAVARTINQGYLVFLVLGVGLMLLAGVLGIIWRVARAAKA